MTAEHANLATALAAFQAELPKIIKDETARVPGKDGKQGYTYGYADLAAVAEAVLPVLGKHGLAFSAKPTMTDSGFGLSYRLVHGPSNEEDPGFWPIQLGPMQTMGSAITYARRYALMAATGVFPDKEDDDGASASQGYRDRGAGGSSADAWDNAAPARPARPTQSPRPSRDEVIAKATAAIAAARKVEDLPGLRELVDQRQGEGTLTDQDAMELYAAINARDSELAGNVIGSSAAQVDGKPISDGRKKRMYALFNELGYSDREKQVDLIQRVTGRTIESRNDVTDQDAYNIIGALESQKRMSGGTNGRHLAAVGGTS